VAELVVHLELATGLEVWDLEVLVECLVEHLVLQIAVLLDHLALISPRLLVKVVMLVLSLEVWLVEASLLLTMVTPADSMVSELAAESC